MRAQRVNPYQRKKPTKPKTKADAFAALMKLKDVSLDPLLKFHIQKENTYITRQSGRRRANTQSTPNKKRSSAGMDLLDRTLPSRKRQAIIVDENGSPNTQSSQHSGPSTGLEKRCSYRSKP
ncbi:hypothetical protein IQ07DRAFT_674635 [Pyrenochaeta sp. DS3sAY3a]|nr:hypothetical protein IQ07DRAFT_674635 [Pyrenochaeta sp. DS3sAY3a]